MTNPLYVLLGCFTLAVSLLTLFRTRTVLRFRSPGRVERGSIPDWQVLAWRVMASVIIILTSLFLYVVVFET